MSPLEERRQARQQREAPASPTPGDRPIYFHRALTRAAIFEPWQQGIGQQKLKVASSVVEQTELS